MGEKSHDDHPTGDEQQTREAEAKGKPNRARRASLKKKGEAATINNKKPPKWISFFNNTPNHQTRGGGRARGL